MAKFVKVFELLDAVAKAKAKKEKIELLRSSDCLELRTMLRGIFDENIKFNLPEGDPPFTECKEGKEVGIAKFIPSFKYFVVGGVGDKMQTFKREGLFVQMLQKVHPSEAKLLLAMKDKDIKKVYKTGITRKMVEEAFPDIL